jgi:uncharacterized protein YbjT (DUF2867 family)
VRFTRSDSILTILFAGATGLIGGHLLKLLPAGHLHLLTRRAVSSEAAQCIGEPVVWPDTILAVKPEIAISTLGTTIRQAGSRAAFRAVDFDLVLSIAQAAKNAGARHFILVSSVGASAKASNFYLKTKGEVEDAVKALGFARVDIMRPGLLRGDRRGPARAVERLMINVAPLTDLLTPFVLDQYRSIKAETVARAIATLIGGPEGGVYIHHNREMLALARLIG